MPEPPKRGGVPLGHAEDKERSVQSEGAPRGSRRSRASGRLPGADDVCVGFGRMTKNSLSRGG